MKKFNYWAYVSSKHPASVVSAKSLNHHSNHVPKFEEIEIRLLRVVQFRAKVLLPATNFNRFAIEFYIRHAIHYLINVYLTTPITN